MKYGLPTEVLDGVTRLVAGLHKHAKSLRPVTLRLSSGLSRLAHADMMSFYDMIDLDILNNRRPKMSKFPMIIAGMAVSAYTAPRSIQTKAGRGAPLFSSKRDCRGLLMGQGAGPPVLPTANG